MSRVTELLESYVLWDDMAKAKRRELDRMRDRRMSVRISYSGAPRGAPQTLADYMAEREELEADLEEIKIRRFEVFSQIMRLMLKLTQYIISVTNSGLFKKTPISEFSVQGKNTKGAKIHKLNVPPCS